MRWAITAGERGLVAVHGFSYAAPGGDCSGLCIVHVGGCRNGHSDFDDEVQHIVSGLDLRTFDTVEKVCFGILAARGCESRAVAAAGCHVDRTILCLWVFTPVFTLLRAPPSPSPVQLPDCELGLLFD